MDQTRKYHQLQPEERITLASMKRQGLSARAMGRALSRSPSTITRESARNAALAQPLPLTRRSFATVLVG